MAASASAAAAAAPGAAPVAHPLEGANRVAALLLAMGKPAASRVLRHFDAAELKEIARVASGLGAVAASDLEVAIEDFARQFAHGVSLLGTAQEVEKLLVGVLPEDQLSEIMSDVLGHKTTNSVWERVSQVPAATLADFLGAEHLQTTALILSKVRSECAAEVVMLMPVDLRAGVMRRMATLKPVNAPALRVLESTMQDALTSFLNKSSPRDASVKIADILNRMDPEQIDVILAKIAETQPDIAKAVRRLLFRFEDIERLTAKARTVVFDQVSAEQVVLALRGTTPEFRELVLASIASRARRMIESELESGDEPDAKMVSDARRAIADRIMSLAAKGEIELNLSDDEPK